MSMRHLHPSVLLVLLLAASVLPPQAAAADKDWSVTFKTKSFVNSQTGYEFGNPEPPGQAPLSRLTFPLDSVWVGAEARRRMDRFSVGLEYMTSLGTQKTGQMKDYDWEDDSASHRLSVYSQSDCRMRQSYDVSADVDMETADWLGLPKAASIRPVVGLRWQRFTFITSDGTQYTYNPDHSIATETPLPGDGIAFEQDWLTAFVGLRLGYVWSDVPLLDHFGINAQLDWGRVAGRNKDQHLLRGARVTKENTDGESWHAKAGLVFGLTESLELGAEADYLKIETTGTHRWIDQGVSMSWNQGVRVWTEQTSFTGSLTWRF